MHVARVSIAGKFDKNQNIICWPWKIWQWIFSSLNHAWIQRGGGGYMLPESPLLENSIRTKISYAGHEKYDNEFFPHWTMHGSRGGVGGTGSPTPPPPPPPPPTHTHKHTHRKITSYMGFYRELVIGPPHLENVGPPLEPWKIKVFFEINHWTSVK